MDFVNEIATPEDVEKYKLKEVTRKYSIQRQTHYGMSIDREREIVLIKVYSGSSRTEDVGRIRFAFIVHGKDYGINTFCDVTRLEDGDRIYTWDLKGISNSTESVDEDEYIIALFKEAMTVFGYQGPSFWGKELPEFTVKFNF